MVVKGSSGEKYTLNSKSKRTYRTCTDYSISGNGMYVARILDRSHRNGSIEAEVESAVKSGSYYDDERPLNVLYTGKKFVGFLYQGDGSLLTDTETESKVSKDSVSLGKNIDSSEKIYIIAVQIIVAIIMAVIGKLVIYPILEKYIYSHSASSIIDALHFLDYGGIPAILVGIASQVYVFIKFRNNIENIILSGLIAMLVHLVGTVLWTLLVLLLMVIVQGTVNFIMRYFVYIIVIIAAVIWIKKKFRL